MTSRLAGPRLYIADLARRHAAMEDGHAPMDALCYRLLAKRLRSALAGQAPTRVRQGLHELPSQVHPVLIEALEARHFDEFGLLYGPLAGDVRALTQALLARLRRPDTDAA